MDRGKEQLWNASKKVFMFFKATLFFNRQDLSVKLFKQ